jgi:Phage gp6-like head-tail connector protein
MSAGEWPTLDELRAFLRMQPDPTEDPVMQDALDTAVDYGNRRTNYRYDDPSITPVPAVAAYAAKLHASRLYRRRDSTDGTIGFGDAGVVRIGRTDPDIEALYATTGPMVVG